MHNSECNYTATKSDISPYHTLDV